MRIPRLLDVGVDPLTPADERYLRSAKVRAEMTMTSVVVLDVARHRRADGSLPLPELLDTVEVRVRRVPRFSQVLAQPVLGLTAPAWVDCGRPDLREQVRLWPGRVDPADLGDVVARIHADPLDLDGPPWRTVLVDLADGRAAMVWGMHHSAADGDAGMSFMDALWADGEQGWSSDPGPRPVAPRPRGGSHLVLAVLAQWLWRQRGPAPAWADYARKRPVARARRVVGRNLRSPRDRRAARRGADQAPRAVAVVLGTLDLRAATRRARALGGAPMDLFVCAAAGAEAGSVQERRTAQAVMLPVLVSPAVDGVPTGEKGLRMVQVEVPVRAPLEEQVRAVGAARRAAVEAARVSEHAQVDPASRSFPPYVSIIPASRGAWWVGPVRVTERYMLPALDPLQPWAVSAVSDQGALAVSAVLGPRPEVDPHALARHVLATVRGDDG